MDSRFEGDELPDATWGICQVHSPTGIVRLVGDDGRPTANGICEHCWKEAKSGEFYSCPVHGLNPKAPGKDGCPVADCLGESGGPTEGEIAREAESLGGIWPGGFALRKDVLAAPEPGPPIERGGEAREGAASEAREVPRDDGGGVEDRQPRRDHLLGRKNCTSCGAFHNPHGPCIVPPPPSHSPVSPEKASAALLKAVFEGTPWRDVFLDP